MENRRKPFISRLMHNYLVARELNHYGRLLAFRQAWRFACWGY